MVRVNGCTVPLQNWLSKRFGDAGVIFCVRVKHAHKGENCEDHKYLFSLQLWLGSAALEWLEQAAPLSQSLALLARLLLPPVAWLRTAAVPVQGRKHRRALTLGDLPQHFCRGAQTPLLYLTSSGLVPCPHWVLLQLMCHLYRTDWCLFPSPHTLCRGKGLATGCDRRAKGQGERHRQHQENPSKTLLHMGKHSSSCSAFGVSWLWSCCYPGFNDRQAQNHQSWWIGGKQRG